MSRIWRAVVTGIFAVLAAVLLTAGAAAAAPAPAAGGVSTDMEIDDPCLHNPSEMCAPPEPGDSDLLPVNRWVSATGQLHGRLGQDVWDDIAEKIQRNGTYPVLISLGNSMWSGGTSMASAAIRMDILDAAGQSADNAAGKLGSSLMSSGVLALVVVIALMVPAWRAARAQGAAPWAQFAKTGAIVALFTVMVAGAQASTTVDGEFVPGRMSPGWFVTVTNDVIARVASAPAAALTIQDGGAGFSYDESAKGDLSCYQYVNTLKSDYTATNNIEAMESSIPLVMSGMWEATGLQVWAVSQFGAENPYGDFSYCRLLEQFSGTTPAEQRAITLRGSDDPVADGSASSLYSLAWQTSTSDQEDRTMVAWAQCRPNGAGGWQLADGWQRVSGDHRGEIQSIVDDCNEWWATPAAFNDEHGTAFDDRGSGFNYTNSETIYRDTDDIRVQNYLLTLQGHTGGGVTSSMAMVYSYVFSAMIMMVVFGMIAVAIIVAKIAALVMMVAVFFALLLALWPSSGKSSSIGKFFAQYVGMALFVFGIQLIFAFLTLITSMMVEAGNSMFGGGSVISMIWTGFAPVVGVIVLHMVFTKFLKLPSPFTLTGAQQWGQAAAGGAVGGAIGAGVMSRMNRVRRNSETALLRTGRRAGSNALGAMTGGKLGRRGRGRAGALSSSVRPSVETAAGGVSSPGGRPLKAGRRVPRDGAPRPGFMQSRLDPELSKQRKAARDADRVAAAERPHGAVAIKGRTVRTPYREGLAARWRGVTEQYEGKRGKERRRDRGPCRSSKRRSAPEPRDAHDSRQGRRSRRSDGGLRRAGAAGDGRRVGQEPRVWARLVNQGGTGARGSDLGRRPGSP